MPVDYDERTQVQKQLLFYALENQAQYGRWLLASLLAVHGGSLLAITQAGDQAATLFAASGTWLVWGIVAALVCGGSAWINFSFASKTYYWAFIALNSGEEPDPSVFTKWVIRITLYGTPLVAAGSLALFVGAAWNAFAVVR